MRKLAWLTLFAAAALLFGAPEHAFAHSKHHHAQQVPSAAVSNAEIAAPVMEQERHADAFVSAAQPQTEKCPHGQSANCEFCCACAGSISVAIATPDSINREMREPSEGLVLATAYLFRQVVLDLSRPPKIFA